MDANDRGFTLIELLIAMAVGLIVLGAVYAVFTVQNKQLANQEQLTEIHQNARIAMEMMVHEISMAGYNQTTAPATITAVNRCTGTTTASNCAGITNAAANTISFAADINGDGDITDSNEHITYYLDTSDGALKRKSTLSAYGQPVVENVESLNFIYYDGATPPNTTARHHRTLGSSITFNPTSSVRATVFPNAFPDTWSRGSATNNLPPGFRQS